VTGFEEINELKLIIIVCDTKRG